MQRTVAVLVALLGSVAFMPSARADRHEGGAGLEFDFLFGARSYDRARFSRIAGDTSPSLISTFEAAPFDDVSVAGAGVDFHFAVNGVRFAIGYARPYVQFAGPIISQDPTSGITTVAQVRSMDANEVQFGLGYEYFFAPASVFADLVGTADSVETDIAVGDKQGTYRSRSFGFSLRLGGRIPFHDAFYFHAAGEVGLTGTRSYGAAIGIGLGI